MIPFAKRKISAYDRLKRTPIGVAVMNAELANRIARIINPICKQMNLGMEITVAQCFLTQETVRKKDNNPYDIDPNEDPNFAYENVLVLNVLFPHPAFLTKFASIKPEVENALMLNGITTLKVIGKVVQLKQ